MFEFCLLALIALLALGMVLIIAACRKLEGRK